MWKNNVWEIFSALRSYRSRRLASLSVCWQLLCTQWKVKVKVGFFYSTTYTAMPRPAALYSRRKWQLIGKSQWCCSAMLQLQHTPLPQSTTPGLHPLHPVSIHQMAPLNPRPVDHNSNDYSLLQLTTQFIDVKRMKGWVDLGGWFHTEIKCLLRESNPDTPPTRAECIVLTFYFWADEWVRLDWDLPVCTSGHGALHVYDADYEHNAGEVWTHAQHQCLPTKHPTIGHQPYVLWWFQQLPAVRRVDNVYEEAGKLHVWLAERSYRRITNYWAALLIGWNALAWCSPVSDAEWVRGSEGSWRGLANVEPSTLLQCWTVQYFHDPILTFMFSILQCILLLNIEW